MEDSESILHEAADGSDAFSAGGTIGREDKSDNDASEGTLERSGISVGVVVPIEFVYEMHPTAPLVVHKGSVRSVVRVVLDGEGAGARMSMYWILRA